MIKTEDVMNEILYGDGGSWVSAIPMLMWCGLRDRFNMVCTRLMKFILRKRD